MTDAPRIIATYARVSSDEQRERQTILNQREALDRRIGTDSGLRVFKHYEDDGVSGILPLEDRPGGSSLLRDAQAGKFTQIWIVRADRLGRDAFELLRIWKVFEDLGIELRATDENIEDRFSFDIQAVVAAQERRKFLERSAEGLNRAARDGRYTGGIVALGYRVEGEKGHARLVPDETLMWGDLSAADLVRRIYKHLTVDGWSCRRIANEFNALGIPTAYRRSGRGVRGRQTQGLWRAGRIRNLVVNPVYRGELQYGRRSTRPNGREVVSAQVQPLISVRVWDAALKSLARNRLIAKNVRHEYLLRSLIRCGTCGLTYCGTWSKGSRYRCNGAMVERGPVEGRCPGASIKGEPLEETVWSDIKRFLRDPGDLIDELLAEINDGGAHAVAEAERITLNAALSALDERRSRAIDLHTRGKINEDEFDAIADEVREERNVVKKRLADLEPIDEELAEATATEDVIAEIRKRVSGSLTEAERQEIVRLLVRRITIHTELPERGRKQASVVIEYRFPSAAPTCKGMGSSPPQA